MTFINLTPHELNVHTPDGVRTFPPSGAVARVPTTNTQCAAIDGIPTVVSEYHGVQMFRDGEAGPLPGATEGVFMIVSGMVADCSFRGDLVSPGPLVRDDKGRPIGCRGLRRSGLRSVQGGS